MKQEELLPEPVAPDDWACCGSGCGENCVWTIYYREKAAYEAQQKRLGKTTVQMKPGKDGRS